MKSGYHFELNFEGLAIPLLTATPGLAFYTPGGLPRKLSRVWPDHDVDEDWLTRPAFSTAEILPLENRGQHSTG